MLIHSRAAVAAVLLAACVVVLGAQDERPGPTFRAGVEAVEVTAYVTDRDGNPVTDLTADEFEILEDGVPQAIASFALVDIPVERVERLPAGSRDLEPDVWSNDVPEGRLYVVLVDEIPAAQAQRIRHFLRPFFEQQFGANDMAAIVYLGRAQSRNTQAFTSSRRLLLDAVDKVQPGFDDPFGDLSTADWIDDSRAAEGNWKMRARMRSLRDLVESLAEIPGRRKAVLYFTTSLGMDVFDVLDYTGGTKSVAFDDLHRAIAAATRGGVAIYPIDPCGLDLGVGGGESPNGCSTSLGEDADLRALGDATGGFGIVNTNSFAGNFARIVRENSTYYLLGFSSTNERRRGRFRKLEVRVRRPGLTVRTRDGYLESRDTADETLRFSTLPVAVADALRNPLPDRSVPLRVSAVPLRGPGKDASVALALELDAAPLGLVRDGDRFVGEMAMATMAVAADGDIHPGQRYEIGLTLAPERYEFLRAGGVRVLTEMQIPPGRYQLRLVAGSKVRAGSVVADVEVPDFSKGPLVMSGVALTSASALGRYTIPQIDALGLRLPGPLTAAREFAAGDRLTVYAEAYENGRRAAHAVEVRVELRSADGRVLHTSTQERASDELSRRDADNGFTASLPLDVEPGAYLVHVQATADIDDRPTVVRDLPIRVR